MTISSPTQSSPWVKGPVADLCFFGFAWVLIVVAYGLVDQSAHAKDWRLYILNFVLLTAVFHRHLTFPLVYGDPVQLKARPKSYLWLPIFFTAITIAGYLYSRPATLKTENIAFPLVVTSDQSLALRIADAQGSQDYHVNFDQSIHSMKELETKFRDTLGARVKVASDGQRLSFQVAGADDKSRIRIFRDQSSPEFFKSLGFGEVSVVTAKGMQPLLIGLVMLSAFWNFYHTLMQKMGILRIYSRKANYGKSWIDKAMVWTWFAWLFFQLGSMPSVIKRVNNLAMSGKYMTESLAPVLKFFPYLSVVALTVALVITLLYLREEWRHRDRLHWPKNIFMMSILMLYGLFFYDFFIAYVAFGFSHAVEYLAFVNIFGRKKYLAQPANSSAMARWIRHQGMAMGLFVFAMAAIFIPWYFYSYKTLAGFILATSFLHFLYDGWIWKVRNPNVGQALGIQYQNSGSQAQVA